MAERLSRKHLYGLVWSQPMTTLTARFGISDVALKKACARADIPTPPRGHWAKKEAGKRTFQPTLPPRSPGMDDELVFGAGGNYWDRGWGKEELPPPPVFAEPLEEVRNRIEKVIGKVSVPRAVRHWHPAIDRLLREDEQRRQKQLSSSYSFSWDAPRFDTPFELRRLRLLNSLFLGTGRMNGKATTDRREAREIAISFHGETVSISLDRPGVQKPDRYGSGFSKQSTSTDSRLRLVILGGYEEKERQAWQDEASARLEARITEIAIDLVLIAEIQHREGAVRGHEWRVKRKAEIEEEERQRKIAAERAERERQARLEQARIDRMLSDAAAFKQAMEIRSYVEVVRDDGVT